MFGYAVGPHSWKKYLHPAEVRLWSAERQGTSFRILNNEVKPDAPQAFLGVRACELAAIAAQDRVLLEDKYLDPIYGTRRPGLFLIAVQCTQPAATCFCASMGTGPAGTSAATSCSPNCWPPMGHRFLVEMGSERGAEVLEAVQTRPATDDDLSQAEAGVEAAARQQVRSIDRRMTSRNCFIRVLSILAGTTSPPAV